MPSPSEYKTIKATHVRIAAERFYVLLEDGRELGIPYDWYWRLAEATPEQLNNWRLIGGGQGLPLVLPTLVSIVLVIMIWLNWFIFQI